MGRGFRLTLLVRPSDAGDLEVGDGIRLPGGSYLLWFTFPGAWHEVGAFYGPDGRLLGHYVNIIRPVEEATAAAAGLGASRPGRGGGGSAANPVGVWRITDLFLDIWIPAGRPPRALDEDEWREAVEEGWIDRGEAARAEVERDRIIEAIDTGTFPPAPVPDRPLESVPLLRLRRDAPGTYRAALLSGRIIGYGLYLLGAVSLTSVAFAAFTDALQRGGPTGWWLWTVAAEAALLLPAALAGRLPGTRWPRPAPTDERTFFIGTVAAALAVLLLQESDTWRVLLTGLYATLGFFLLLFAACRAWYDRVFPLVAVAGLAVAAAALLILL